MKNIFIGVALGAIVSVLGFLGLQHNRRSSK